MTPFIAEFIGTAVLILFGNGVVANVLLKNTKGHGTGLMAIVFGWAIAVFAGVFIAGSISGAHINPAVTIGLATAGEFDWANVPGYLIAQFAGAAVGALLVWVHYKPHYDTTTNSDEILATFCTGPAIKNTVFNLISEVIGTFALVFGVFYISGAKVGDADATLGALDALPVALLVLGIGLCLGGTTGYAINPARDLAPRIMHAILPISNKGKNDWSYSWIPVVGPIIGGVLAALLYMAL